MGTEYVIMESLADLIGLRKKFMKITGLPASYKKVLLHVFME